MNSNRVEVSEKIGLSEGLTIIVESQHLLISNRKKCQEMLKRKEDLTPEERIDFMLSLHLVLEIGINTLYRQFFFRHHAFGWFHDEREVDYLDNISFIQKVVSMIYFSKFKFSTTEAHDKANQYLKVIAVLKNFSQTRNNFLHGHTVSKISLLDKKNSKTTVSKTSKLTSMENLNHQIEAFKFAVEALKFYFSHIECAITIAGRESMMKEFLDTSFLD